MNQASTPPQIFEILEWKFEWLKSHLIKHLSSKFADFQPTSVVYA